MKSKNIMVILAVTFMSYSFAEAKDIKVQNSKVVNVEIGKKGFQPSKIMVAKGENLILMVKRTTNKTCMTELKHPKSGKLVKFPMNKNIKFEVGSFSEAKKVDLLCGMDMKAGVIHIN